MENGKAVSYPARLEAQRFNFAAARYLAFWLRVDRSILKSFADRPSEAEVKYLLNRYSVRRTIPTKLNKENLDHFISILEERVPIGFTEEKTGELIRDICKEVGKKIGLNPLSAVSKYLWMRCGHPIAIYDRYAKEALFGKRAPDYAEYYFSWIDCYHNKIKFIDASREWLVHSSLFKRFKDHDLASHSEMVALIDDDRFANRVFDQWLLIGSSNFDPVEFALLLSGHEFEPSTR